MIELYKMFLRIGLLSILTFTFFVNIIQAQTYTFTSAGATGREGPTQSEVNTEYTNTPLDGKVTVTNGIQKWSVPATGLYEIEVYGAEGGGPAGGLGAYMKGTFSLTQGDSLQILVGQEGEVGGSRLLTGGGGGGTFVVDDNNNPLIIAGGGGGGAAMLPQRHGTASAIANDGQCPVGGAADNCDYNGTGGATNETYSPGGAYSTDGGTSGRRGTGGAGFYSDGEIGQSVAFSGSAPSSFLNGGEGSDGAHADGGFGGGGGAYESGYDGGAGGGGYSGGGGATDRNNNSDQVGGGGGSFNAGSDIDSSSGVKSGHGLVIITPLSTGATNDVGVVSIDSPNVYCPGTHNVVATVQNFGINQIDSVTLNWSVDGVAQTSVKYIGTLDTFGGTGSPTVQVTLGSFNFSTNAPYDIDVWTTMPNGVADTVPANDLAEATKQSSLPPPTGLRASVVNATDAVLKWNGGSTTNSWLYSNVTFGNSPTNPGTSVSVDSAEITSLSPTTTYDFYVREVCPTGDTSAWAGPFTYRTPCSSILNGDYTIDPGQSVSPTNFVSIADAVDALDECGINAPVTFRIASGTYNEQLELEEIAGASATNTIRFVGPQTGTAE
ncbi:MAG: fibronectin type III domain-containing protein, partial [Bacteroidia bacterium]